MKIGAKKLDLGMIVIADLERIGSTDYGVELWAFNSVFPYKTKILSVLSCNSMSLDVYAINTIEFGMIYCRGHVSFEVVS